MKTKLFAAPYIVWMAIFILVPLGACAYYAFTDPNTGSFTFANIKAIETYLPTFIDSLWLAAIAAAKIMGVSTEIIARALSSFKGIKHRIEKVGVVDGVQYIDDSKATNVDATVKAIGAIKGETVLLLGGKDKGYNYDKLFSALRTSTITQAVLYGENRLKLLDSAMKTGYKNVTLCESFFVAVHLARLTAKEGQTVLLSPASASFDEFAGYEERGEKFVEIVESFKQKSERNAAQSSGVFDETRMERAEEENEIE